MSKVEVLDAAKFESDVRGQKGVWLVDFWADWCQPCHRMTPVLNELAKDYEHSVRFAKVNVDEQTDLAKEFNIQSIPQLIAFVDGLEVGRIVGVQPKAQIAHALDHLTGTADHEH